MLKLFACVQRVVADTLKGLPRLAVSGSGAPTACCHERTHGFAEDVDVDDGPGNLWGYFYRASPLPTLSEPLGNAFRQSDFFQQAILEIQSALRQSRLFQQAILEIQSFPGITSHPIIPQWARCWLVFDVSGCHLLLLAWSPSMVMTLPVGSLCALLV